jgi:hypothetical protein
MNILDKLTGSGDNGRDTKGLTRSGSYSVGVAPPMYFDRNAGVMYPTIIQ